MQNWRIYGMKQSADAKLKDIYSMKQSADAKLEDIRHETE
jgi:hypothetical protein